MVVVARFQAIPGAVSRALGAMSRALFGVFATP
jgi:hypothetical protein